jgi:hypothetical protein
MYEPDSVVKLQHGHLVRPLLLRHLPQGNFPRTLAQQSRSASSSTQATTLPILPCQCTIDTVMISFASGNLQLLERRTRDTLIQCLHRCMNGIGIHGRFSIKPVGMIIVQWRDKKLPENEMVKYRLQMVLTLYCSAIEV